MSFKTVEDAILEQAALISGLTPASVARGDTKILARGPERALVTKYNSMATSEQLRFGADLQYNWRINLELYTKYKKTDDELYNNASEFRQAVLDYFGVHRTIGAEPGVFDCLIMSGNTVDSENLINLTVGSHKFHSETLILIVQEEVEYTLVD